MFKLHFGNKLRNTNFEVYCNSSVFFNLRTCFVRAKSATVFSFYLYFLAWLRNSFELTYWFKIYWSTLMKILYLKGYKWLLSQNQRVRNDSFSHRRCETLAKHIKRFLKKVKGCQWLDYRLWKWIHMFKCMLMTFTLSVTPIWTMKENKDIKVISDLLSNIILRKLRLRQKK